MQKYNIIVKKNLRIRILLIQWEEYQSFKYEKSLHDTIRIQG